MFPKVYVETVVGQQMENGTKSQGSKWAFAGR